MVISYINEEDCLRVVAFNGLKDFWKRAEKTPLVNSHAMFVSSGELKIGFPTDGQDAMPVGSFDDLKRIVKEIPEVPALSQLETYLDGSTSFKSEQFYRPLIESRIKAMPLNVDAEILNELIEYALTQLNPVVFFEGNDTDKEVNDAVVEAVNLAMADFM